MRYSGGGKGSGIRIAITAAVYLLLVAGFLKTWLLDGLVAPCRVVGSSMAETLQGAHRHVVCAACGFQFACDAEGRPLPPCAVCPNCGYADNQLDLLAGLDGDRLCINRAAFVLRGPRRWEVVALRRPEKANELLVKRVVGLPGETVEIRHGDLYIDGRIQRKDLAEQHALAILIHDADYRSTREPTTPPRWRGENKGTRWISDHGRFSHPGGSENEPPDWLVYHHERRLPDNRPDPYVESPVTDLGSYNPAQPRREEDVHPVADLLLSFRLNCGGVGGTVFVRATDGGDDFEVRLKTGDGLNRYEVYHKRTDREGFTQTARPARPFPEPKGEIIVEVSLIDQQFLLAVDGHTLCRLPYERSDPPPLPPATPLAIGIRGAEASVRQLRVFRDVYYTSPRPAAGQDRTRVVRLGEDQYYVLGDNSPVSEDSRHWPERGAVDAKLLMGKPFLDIPSTLLSPWRGAVFQVPNLAQIRYIY